MSTEPNRFEQFAQRVSDFVGDQGNQNLAIGAMGFAAMFLVGLNYVVPALGGGFWTQLFSLPIIFSAAAMATPTVVRWTRGAIDRVHEFIDNPNRTAGLEPDVEPTVAVTEVQDNGRVTPQNVAQQIEAASRLQVADVSDTDIEDLPPQQVLAQQHRAAQNLIS